MLFLPAQPESLELPCILQFGSGTQIGAPEIHIGAEGEDGGLGVVGGGGLGVDGGGGGGGGGGGFGGSSHWSSSRSYSFRSRTTYGSSGTSDCDCECGKAMACFQCLLISGGVVVFCLIFGLSVGFGVRNEQMPKSKIATDFYSPGDSRLISFSSFFCNSVHFSVESQATGASFFLVDSAPPLTDQNNFKRWN